MTDNVQRILSEKRSGDTAVDGLLAGILGGVGMMLILIVAGLLTGENPAMVMGRFDPNQTAEWLPGALAHLAVSGVYGLLFALGFTALVRLRPAMRGQAWLSGLVYGLILYGLAWWALLPAADSPMAELGAARLAVGHIVYGLLLGEGLRRRL